MGSINVLGGIGMAFFFLKFYIFIGIKYIFNFLQHIFEKLIHGNSKTVICPYEKTHQDVFLTIGKCYIKVEQLIRFNGFSIDDYEFETPDGAYVSFWRVKSTDAKIKPQKYPALILHGLLDCSISWFLHSDKYI